MSGSACAYKGCSGSQGQGHRWHTGKTSCMCRTGYPSPKCWALGSTGHGAGKVLASLLTFLGFPRLGHRAGKRPMVFMPSALGLLASLVGRDCCPPSPATARELRIKVKLIPSRLPVPRKAGGWRAPEGTCGREESAGPPGTWPVTDPAPAI